MKKMRLCLFALAFCLALCACSTEEVSVDDGLSSDTASTDDTTESRSPFMDVLGDIAWTMLGQYDAVPITTLHSGELSENGWICGAWDVDGTTLTMTYFEDALTGTASAPLTYEIIEHNGLYFLVGSDTLYCSVSPTHIPVNHVEITADNFWEYFEPAKISIVKRATSTSGEVIESTTEKQVLKLKPEYISKLNPNVTSLIVQTSYMPEKQYVEYLSIPGRIETLNGSIPIYDDWTYIFGLDTWCTDEEILYIKGSLAFIDGL